MIGGYNDNVLHYKELPFHSVNDYNIETEYLSVKQRILNSLDNEEFNTYLKENKFDQLFNPFDQISCQCFEEDEFIGKNRNGDEFLNIFSMNIRSLPKHGGELFNFLGILKTKFDIIILTEIGARNLTLVENLLPNYDFYFVKPCGNNYGGVGIYMSKSLLNVAVLNDIDIVKTCDCKKL